MKKLIIKLGAFVILSIILSANLQVFAATPTCDSGFIENGILTIHNGDQCIKEGEKKDKTNIITIVEEPLDITMTNPDFRTIQCTRKTVICGKMDEKGNVKRVSAAELVETSACTPDEKTGTSCNEVMVIISKVGPSMIEGYISMIYKWAAGFVGLIAVAVIIISSIQISLSGGDSQAVTNSKDRILKSLAGLAVLFLSGLILYTVNPNFFTYTPQ
jgi:hypothetical protein